MLRVGKTYVKVDEDNHICSIVRLHKKTVIEPQTAVICHVKLQKGFQLSDSRLLEVTNFEPGCILDEPGLTLKESVNTVKSPFKVPVLIVNETTKCYRLRRGSVVGRARPLTPQDVSSLDDEEPMEIDEPEPERSDSEDLCVPENRRHDIIKQRFDSKE